MSDGFSPPEGVRAAARRGLELRRKFGRGGTLVGVARARDLSNGKSISASTIKRMVSFFARHAVDKRPNWSDPSKPTNGYIAHMLWGGDAGRSWANKVSRSIDAKKSVTEKHLPGKHNQRTHGRRGYGSSSGGGMSAAAFVAESTRLGDQTQRELDGIAQATPRQWSFEDENAFIDGVTADKPADYLNQQTVRDRMAQWSARCQREGLTPEQALRAWNIAISQQGNTDMPSELTDMTVLLTTIKIQDLHHERAVAVSRMSYAEQDAAYDLVRARIDSKRDARHALLNSGVGVFDLPYDPELVSDCEAIMALSLYGNPALRLRAVAYGTNSDYYPFGEGGMPIAVRREKVNSAGRRVPVDIAKHESTITGGIEYYSLDYRLHVTSFDTNQYGERTALPEKRHQEEFIQSFTKTHTTQNTSNVLGAAIQSAMSQVGPNRESSAQSLYPKGIKPPEPHPTVVKFLQNRYEQTQQEYAQRGVTEVQLYRGTRRGPINGIPMSPWSDDQKVANNFTGGDFLAGTPGYKPTLNRAPNMPSKYVFMHYGQSDFKTAFTENEFLILETTALRRGRIISRGKVGFGDVDDLIWSMKQLQAPNPYDQADGIVDYSLVSLYEPQYDIFYNYREKPSKSKVKKKHLPGAHNQRAHGRRGPDKGGSGGGGGGMTASEYVQYADKIDTDLQQQLNDLVSRAPITWSQEDKDRVTRHGMETLNKYNQTALPKDKYTEQEIAPKLQQAIESAQQSGFTPDEIISAMNNRFEPRHIATMLNANNIADVMMKEAHNKRAIAISHMSDKEQNAVYDVYSARAQVLLNKKSIQNLLGLEAYQGQEMTQTEKEQLVSASEQIYALSLYGNPDLRLRAVTFINSELFYNDIRRTVPLKTPKVTTWAGITTTETHDWIGSSIKSQVEYYSLEHRLYTSQNNSSSANLRESFIQAFTYTHTSQNTENVLGAAIQTAMSQVGPNASAPAAKSFYKPGIKPPRPHPTVVRLLNEQYQETQREFARQGITTVKLYRGIADDFTMGIPMSPWSARKSVSAKFGTIMNTATMPVKYVFMYDGQPLFKSRYVEREHLVFETAALANAKSKRTGNNVSWTSIKNLTDADGKTMPPENSYESQYDIFYNYKKRAKKSVTQKHLPGAHNQRAHGRRGPDKGGGGSGGGSSAYPAVKYGTPTEGAPKPIALSELHPTSEFMQTGIKETVNERWQGYNRQISNAISEAQTKFDAPEYTGDDNDVHAKLQYLEQHYSLWWMSSNVPEDVAMFGQRSDESSAEWVMRTKEFQAYVYRRLGYNGKPTTVPLSELDSQTDVIKSNGDRTRMFYRGVQQITIINADGTAKKMTAQDVTNDFRNGSTHYVGSGVDGNGTYATYVRDMDRTRGESYDDENFRQYRHARTYSGAPSDWDNTTGDAPEFRSGASDMIAFTVRGSARVNTEPMYRIIGYTELETRSTADFRAMQRLRQSNPGVAMALLGYQGYYADQDRFVLLDRSVAIVGSSTPYEPVKVIPDFVKQRMKK